MGHRNELCARLRRGEVARVSHSCLTRIQVTEADNVVRGPVSPALITKACKLLLEGELFGWEAGVCNSPTVVAVLS